jgi:hypothetical protein
MGCDNLQPAFERFKLTAGFIAGSGRNTDTDGTRHPTSISTT